MAISFTAEYLYQGAKVLSRNPVNIEEGFECPEALFRLARGVYSLGVLVIAPIGILYHLAAMGVYYARSLTERDVAPLNQLVEQHMEAGGCDIGGVVQSIAAPILVASVVAVVFFQVYICIAPLALGAYGVFCADLPERFLSFLFLPLGYALDPTEFTHFLPLDWGHDRPLHLKDESVGRLGYEKLVREGIAVDQPLTAEQSDEMYRILDREDPWPFSKALSVYDYLLQENKIQPAYQARLQAFVNRQADIALILNEVIDLHSHNGPHGRLPLIADDNARHEAMTNDFVGRVRPLIAALPPVGAPGPSVGQAAAQA